jgi:RNA polymerase sigma factor (sigma-70 family)
VSATSWALVERAQAGDMDAVAEIYRAERDMLYRICWRRCRSNPTLVEDIVSETFARFLRALPTLTSQGRDVGALLVTIALNLIRDHHKSAGTQRVSLVDTTDLLAEVPGDADVESDAQRTELRAVLGDVLAAIPHQQADALRLRYLDDLSIEETAARLGVAQGTVKARAWRGVRSAAEDERLEAYR